MSPMCLRMQVHGFYVLKHLIQWKAMPYFQKCLIYQLGILLEGVMEDEKKLLQVEDEKENTKVGQPADSFKGVPMQELISTPLIAASEAQQQLAASTLDFYNKAFFEDDGKKHHLEFDLGRPVQAPGGIGKEEVHVKEPFLGLVPVPALLIDDVNINFQMEATETSASKSVENADLSAYSTSKCFGASVSMQGRVVASRENTRSTNPTAKYQVSVSTSQQQQEEGLSKVMDIMASSIESSGKKE